MRKTLVICLIGLSAAAAAQAEIVLYNPTPGTSPASQGWVYLTDPPDPPFDANSAQGPSGGKWKLDTTPVRGESAGYFGSFHPLMPVLDRQAGYSVRFQAGLNAENHVSNDRAGFSVIALSSDNMGIELGFWLDGQAPQASKVWAQSPSFVHAEEGIHNTGAMTQYDLQVSGGGYRLLADNQEILAGALRDYDPVHPVYSLTNFLFFGDNTSSASADVLLGEISVTVNDQPFVPEPATLTLLAVGLTGLAGRVRRLRRVA